MLGMLGEWGLIRELERVARSPTGEALCIHGDPAYPVRVHLWAPFCNTDLTEEMNAFNKALSSDRISVEWLFAEIVKYFKLVYFKTAMSIRLSSIWKICIVCAFFQNA